MRKMLSVLFVAVFVSGGEAAGQYVPVIRQGPAYPEGANGASLLAGMAAAAGISAASRAGEIPALEIAYRAIEQAIRFPAPSSAGGLRVFVASAGRGVDVQRELGRRRECQRLLVRATMVPAEAHFIMMHHGNPSSMKHEYTLFTRTGQWAADTRTFRMGNGVKDMCNAMSGTR